MALYNIALYCKFASKQFMQFYICRKLNIILYKMKIFDNKLNSNKMYEC